ncbi:alpha/beta hydrolase family protein [Spirochaetota bacterium]
METEKISFYNDREKLISGRIYRGVKKSHRGLIFSHGLFSTKDGYKITRLAESIVDAGYILLTFDFSFSGESEGHISDISILQEVEDLKCAVKFFQNYGITDLHLMGSSMGGVVTLLYTSANIENLKSVIAIATPVDLRKTIFRNIEVEQIDVLQDDALVMLHNIPVKNKFFKEIRKIDMTGAVKKIYIPVLIIHGENDEVVDVSNAHLLKEILHESELVIIKNGDHSLNKMVYIEIIRKNIIPWLGKMK